MVFADTNYTSAPCFNHLHTCFTEYANILLLLITVYAAICLDIVLFNAQVIAIAIALLYTGFIQFLMCSYIMPLPSLPVHACTPKTTCQAQKDQHFPPQQMEFLPLPNQGIQHEFCILCCMLAYCHLPTSPASFSY